MDGFTLSRFLMSTTVILIIFFEGSLRVTNAGNSQDVVQTFLSTGLPVLSVQYENCKKRLGGVTF